MFWSYWTVPLVCRDFFRLLWFLTEPRNFPQSCVLMGRWFYKKIISVHPEHGHNRTGVLRTFWEPDRALGSPLRGLCVQGTFNCLTERAILHPVHGNPRTGLLTTFWNPHRILRSPFQGLCVQGAHNYPSISKDFLKSALMRPADHQSQKLDRPR